MLAFSITLPLPCTNAAALGAALICINRTQRAGSHCGYKEMRVFYATPLTETRPGHHRLGVAARNIGASILMDDSALFLNNYMGLQE
jgi:hypothetical protein